MKRIARVEFSGSKDYILPEGDINSAHQTALMKFHDDFPVNKYHLVDVNNVWIAKFPDEQNPELPTMSAEYRGETWNIVRLDFSEDLAAIWRMAGNKHAYITVKISKLKNLKIRGAMEVKEDHTILEEVFKIANNAIYFRDNSDYLTALNEICNAIHPDDEMVGEILIESTTPR